MYVPPEVARGAYRLQEGRTIQAAEGVHKAPWSFILLSLFFRILNTFRI